MDRFFGLSEANTTIRREILAGLSTFLTMSFIVAVNPMFLADAGIPFAAGFVATVLATSIGTAIMALWAKWPVAVAPAWAERLFCLRSGPWTGIHGNRR